MLLHKFFRGESLLSAVICMNVLYDFCHNCYCSLTKSLSLQTVCMLLFSWQELNKLDGAVPTACSDFKPFVIDITFLLEYFCSWAIFPELCSYYYIIYSRGSTYTGWYYVAQILDFIYLALFILQYGTFKWRGESLNHHQCVALTSPWWCTADILLSESLHKHTSDVGRGGLLN